jgi:hypothetical protein
MRQISQTSLEVDAERKTKMPFTGDCHSFDSSTLKALNSIGAVYGLFKTDLPFRPDHYTCLYVGQSNDLRTRMLEHYNNPPIIGVTHFFAEAIATEEQRIQREKELICEFNLTGNKTTGRPQPPARSPFGDQLPLNASALADAHLPEATTPKGRIFQL